MSRMIAASVAYFFRPETLRDTLGTLVDHGYDRKSQEYKDFARVKTFRFFTILVSSYTLFTAVTPWIFHEEEVASAEELRLLLDCPTFQFTNHLSIFWIADKKAASDLILRAIKSTARNLTKLHLVLNNESCLTEELERMLINAHFELPYLSDIKFHNVYNDLTIRDNKYRCSRDVDLCLAILRSDALAFTNNGRKLKASAAAQIFEMVSYDMKRGHGMDCLLRDFLELPAADRTWASGNRERNGTPVAAANRVNVLNKMDDQDEAVWQDVVDDDDDDDGDGENVGEDETTATTTNTVVGFDVPFILHHCLEKQNPDFFLRLAYAKILVTINTDFTGRVSGDKAEPLLRQLAPVIVDFLEFTLVDYKILVTSALHPESAATLRQAQQRQLNQNGGANDEEDDDSGTSSGSILEALKQQNKNEVKINFQEAIRSINSMLQAFTPHLVSALIDEYYDSILKSYAEVMGLILEQKFTLGTRADVNRNAVILTTHKTDSIISRFIVTLISLISFVPSADTRVGNRHEEYLAGLGQLSEAQAKIHERNRAVVKLLPFDLLARFLDSERHVELICYSIEYLEHALKSKALVPADYIFGDDELLKSLTSLLKIADRFSAPFDIFLVDLLVKLVAFEFNPAARHSNAICFEKWKTDLEWLSAASKRLEDFGVLEAAFAHLHSFTVHEALELQRNGQQCSRIFSFYIIDALVFSEGITAEAKRVNEMFNCRSKNNVAPNNKTSIFGSWGWTANQQAVENVSDDFVTYGLANFDYGKAESLGADSSAVKRIRENIPNACDIITTFAARVPSRFRNYSGDRFAAVKRAIAGPDAEKKNGPFASGWGTSNSNHNNLFDAPASWVAWGKPSATTSFSSSSAATTTTASTKDPTVQTWGVPVKQDSDQATSTAATTTTSTVSTGWGGNGATENKSTWGSWGSTASAANTAKDEEKKEDEEVVWEDEKITTFSSTKKKMGRKLAKR